VIPVAPPHIPTLVALHAAAFASGEQWGLAAMADILAMPGTLGFIDDRGGMILARAIVGEVEILTLAVAPTAQRQGIGRALVAELVAAMPGQPIFLEVAADNAAGQGLYRNTGFIECGRRKNYYGPGRDALILRR
jgi:ribosomal-protein-alanine N-acetyltransferase